MAVLSPKTVYAPGVMPAKSQIIQLLEQIMGSASAPAVVKETKAQLDLVTPASETYGGLVLNDSDPTKNGYYYRSSATWVKGRGFPDTFAKATFSGTGTAQTMAFEPGVNPADVLVYFGTVSIENTGAFTLGGVDVVNAAGNALSAGEWTGTVIFFLNGDGDYQLLFDAGAVAAAAQSATDAADSATEAAGYAAGLNLPAVTSGDAGKFLTVKPDETGYNLSVGSGGFGIDIRTMGVMGDNSTDDRDAIVQALIDITAAGKVVVVPEGTYLCSDWIPLPDGLKLWFAPGAVWKLTANTALGGLVCGGYLDGLTPTPFTNAEIWNMVLDCNELAGENAINAINAVNVKFHNPQVFRTRHSTSTLGGRAFQFEGAIVDGLHIYNPYIEDCSVGINSQGDPFGATEIARNIHYFNVVMRNVDSPFNIDGQFATPDAGSRLNMSTYVHGAKLFNCGKPRWTGNPGATTGGIITADRGFGMTIEGLSVLNDTIYGEIGSLFRGTAFDLRLNNVEVDAAVGRLFDFRSAPYTGAGTGASRIRGNVLLKGNTGVLATASSTAEIGLCDLEISYGSDASLDGFFDNSAAAAGNAFATINYLDNAQCLGKRTFKAWFEAGNIQTGLIQQTIGFYRLDHAKSAVVDSANTAIFNIAIENHSKIFIAYRIMLATNQAVTGGVLSTSGHLTVDVAYDGTITPNSDVIGVEDFAGNGISTWTCSVTPVDLGGGLVALVINQANDQALGVTAFVVADIIYSVGEVRKQPKIGLY